MNKVTIIIARVAGTILLLFGLGLTALSIYVIERQLSLRGAIDNTAWIIIFVFLLISLFCFLIGYRFAFNRPNRHGSTFSPASWAVLGTISGALGLFISSAIITMKHYRVHIIITAIVLLSFSVGCWCAKVLLTKRIKKFNESLTNR